MPNVGKTKDFIKNLQEKDEKTKRVYLAIASSVSMIAVIILWVLYLNFTVPTVGQGNTTSTTTTIDYLPHPPGNAAGNSFLDTLGRGFSSISDGFTNGVGNITDQIGSFVSRLEKQLRSEFQKTNTFNIQGGSQTNGQPSFEPATTTLEVIPTTTLP